MRGDSSTYPGASAPVGLFVSITHTTIRIVLALKRDLGDRSRALVLAGLD
jgi:hypothetical protein